MSDEDAERLEQVFKALADRHRVRIINRLITAGGEAVCVCDFEDMLDLKQSSVSYHLKQLLTAGIVEREKRGSFAYYRLAPVRSRRSSPTSTCRSPQPPERPPGAAQVPITVSHPARARRVTARTGMVRTIPTRK